MKLEHEDPRVIDYVLGELPEDERAEVRAALDDPENADAAAFARELGGLAGISREALGAEMQSETEALQTVASFSSRKQTRMRRTESQAWGKQLMQFSTVAAILFILVGVTFISLPQVREQAHLAELNTPLVVAADKGGVPQASMADSISPEDLSRLQENVVSAREHLDAPAAPAPPQPAPPAVMAAPKAPASAKDLSQLKDEIAGDLDDLPGSTITRGTDIGRFGVAPAPAAAPAPQVAGTTESAPAESWGYEGPPGNELMSPSMKAVAPEKKESAQVAFNAPQTPTPASSLQNVEVGGGIRIRDNWHGDKEVRTDVAFVEQRTWQNFKADFVDSVGNPMDMRQLEALGYGGDSDGDGIVGSNGFGVTNRGGIGGFGGGSATRPVLQFTMPVQFKSVMAEPLSTFAADVDTASYTLARREIQGGRLPDAGRVRTEEFINYFDYAYPEPTGEHPFSVTVDIAGCPWAPEHRLARVGIRGKAMDAQERVAANLVFLVDVSGSMNSPDKLPLVRESLRGLLETLKESDRVALVTYAGDSRVVLPPTSCERKDKIRAAIDSLGAGGSTNGAGGIVAAYDLAQKAFIAKGINRVMIATDGDFNVGVTSQSDLERLITERAKTGVFLSVLGYGTGNLNDKTLETLADKGNGFYAYIDDIGEARRVLVEKGLSAIATIAKDVKFQIEFNPAKVGYYRQIGYENRQLAAQDFNDDTKDAGDIGPGHTVTALYELVPAGQSPTPGVDPLKYQQTEPAPPVNDSPETMTVKLRYKQPEAQVSQLLQVPVTDAGTAFEAAPADFRFASAVAAFAQVLKGLQLAQAPTLEQIRAIADATKGNDPARQEFVDLVVTTKTLLR